MPKCAISYSYDSDIHRKWVANLALDLIELKIDLIFDQMHLNLGADIMHFMEVLVRDSDFVLMILTENYKRKVDARDGGAGYEGSIISAELYAAERNERKFVPLLRSGTNKTAIPTFLGSRKYLDLRENKSYRRRLEELRRHILGLPQFDPKEARPTYEPDLRVSGAINNILKGEKSARRLRRPNKHLLRQRGPKMIIDDKSVYLSFPFDHEHLELFRSVVFTVLYMGFIPVTPLDTFSGSEKRLSRVSLLIYNSPMAIFNLDGASRHQNVAFELGVRLSAEKSGWTKYRPALILDRNRYGYLETLSDIAGTEICAHEGSQEKAVQAVIRYLNLNSTPRKVTKMSRSVLDAYRMYSNAAPKILRTVNMTSEEMTHRDFVHLVSTWLSS